MLSGFTAYRDKCGEIIGRLNPVQIAELNASLTFMMGLADT
jgi:hypothetical protein